MANRASTSAKMWWASARCGAPAYLSTLDGHLGIEARASAYEQSFRWAGREERTALRSPKRSRNHGRPMRALVDATRRALERSPLYSEELGIDLAEDHKRGENRKRRASLSFW
jgi:hypothetical protein